MRPKPNIIVVGLRPELRLMLSIAAGMNVWPAETLPQLVRSLSAADIRLVIIDWRDIPTLAGRAASHLAQLSRPVKTILIAGEEEQRREPVCDSTLREGQRFYDRLLCCVRMALVRKRGPKKGSHHLCPL